MKMDDYTTQLLTYITDCSAGVVINWDFRITSFVVERQQLQIGADSKNVGGGADSGREAEAKIESFIGIIRDQGTLIELQSSYQLQTIVSAVCLFFINKTSLTSLERTENIVCIYVYIACVYSYE